jgi:HK97 family phage major capsid protein/HK97 family phage prohead protease
MPDRGDLRHHRTVSGALKFVGDTAAFEFDVIASDGSIDRMGDVLVPEGCRYAAFLRNPVVLAQHDAASPIARVIDFAVRSDKVLAKIRFPEPGVNARSDEYRALVNAGILGACSVGFIPIRSEPMDGDTWGRRYLEWEICELSIVSVPANSNALFTAKELNRQVMTKGFYQMPKTAFATRSRPSLQLAGGNGGFQSLGANLRAIARAARDRTIDDRLVRAPSGASEADPAGGGFLIAPNFATELLDPLYVQNPLAELVDRWPVSGPLADVRIPAVDETSRADGSRWGGALAFWANEADSISGSFPRYRNLQFAAKKLMVVMTVTNELAADSSIFEEKVRRVIALELGWKLDQAILSGTGAGQPQGILNASALITIAKDVGQAAATISPANVENMYRRLPAPSRRRAAWLVHEDVEATLDQLNVSDNHDFMFLPAGWNGSPYPLLKGRPVIAIEQAAPLGTVGDIVLADLSQYILLDGGITPSLSADVRFLSDETVWRFSYRVDGQSAYSSPITPFSGSTTRSPFITLAARP